MIVIIIIIAPVKDKGNKTDTRFLFFCGVKKLYIARLMYAVSFLICAIIDYSRLLSTAARYQFLI